MGPAKQAFSWVPKMDLYPLFTVCGAAIGVCVYASLRNFATNPDVHLTAAHKSDGAHESGITLERAKGYHPSIFRSIAELRGKHDGRTDTRIFQG